MAYRAPPDYERDNAASSRIDAILANIELHHTSMPPFPRTGDEKQDKAMMALLHDLLNLHPDNQASVKRDHDFDDKLVKEVEGLCQSYRVFNEQIARTLRKTINMQSEEKQSANKNDDRARAQEEIVDVIAKLH